MNSMRNWKHLVMYVKGKMELPVDDSSSKAGEIQHFMSIFLKNGIKMKSEDIWRFENI